MSAAFIASPCAERRRAAATERAVRGRRARRRSREAQHVTAASADGERAMPRPCQRLREIIRDGGYKVVLLDQFGVLHDGRVAYDAAVACVEQLHAHGVATVILSNTSRRSQACAQKLEALGFPRRCFAGFATSGELAQDALVRRRAELPIGGGGDGRSTCVLHTNWGERGAIDISAPELRLSAVGRDAERAELVLTHGTEAFTRADGSVEPATLEELQAALRRCAERDLLLLCANPDIVTVDGDELRVMPGTLAAEYERHGGRVMRLGKPDGSIYEYARRLAGVDDVRKMLAIGDSLEHDIAGAARARVDTLFIAGGIFARQLGASPASKEAWQLEPDVLCALMKEEAPSDCPLPTYAMDYLRW